jgi:hypothetical protein
MAHVPASHAAFAGDSLLLHGALPDVALAVRHALDSGETRPIVVMEALTAQVVDLDLRGTDAEIVARLASALDTPETDDAASVRSSGPGRPRLGVVSREVSLLPRHWDWLKTQRGGASATLRRLVDEARGSSGNRDRVVAAQEAVDRYLRVMAGDRPHYEEALRAFYAKRDADLERHSAAWPLDVRAHLQTLVRRCREAQSP